MRKTVSYMTVDLTTAQLSNVTTIKQILEELKRSHSEGYYLNMGAQGFRSSYGYVLGSIFCIVQEWKSQFDGEDTKGIDECIDIVLRELERLAHDSANKKIGALFSEALQPKDPSQRFPMDLKIMAAYLKDLGREELMRPIYPGYESLVRVAKKMEDWCSIEMVMAHREFSKLSGALSQQSIHGKPIACPEEWLTSGMPPEAWLSEVCHPLIDRSLDNRIYMLGNVHVEGCGKRMMLKVSGLVYAAKIVDIMNREPIQFEPENYNEIRGLLAKSSSGALLPTIFSMNGENCRFPESFTSLWRLNQAKLIDSAWCRAAIRSMDVFSYLRYVMLFNSYLNDPKAMLEFSSLQNGLIQEIDAFKACVTSWFSEAIDLADMDFLTHVIDDINCFNEHQRFVQRSKLDHYVHRVCTTLVEIKEFCVEVRGSNQSLWTPREVAIQKVHDAVIMTALRFLKSIKPKTPYPEVHEGLKQQLRNGLSRDQVISENRLDAVSMKLMIAFMASVQACSVELKPEWCQTMMAWVHSHGDLDLLEWLEKLLALSGNSKGHFLDPFGGAVINMMESALTDLFWMGQGAILSEEEQQTLPKRDTNYTEFVRHACVSFQLYVMPVGSPIPFYGLMMQSVHVSDFALIETLSQIIPFDLPYGLVQLNKRLTLQLKSPSLITEALVVALNRMQILIDLSQEFFNNGCNKNSVSELMVSARDRMFKIEKYRILVSQFEQQLVKKISRKGKESWGEFFGNGFTNSFINLVVYLPQMGCSIEFRWRMLPVVVGMIGEWTSFAITEQFRALFKIEEGEYKNDQELMVHLMAFVMEHYFFYGATIESLEKIERNEQVALVQQLTQWRDDPKFGLVKDRLNSLMESSILADGVAFIERLALAKKQKSLKEERDALKKRKDDEAAAKRMEELLIRQEKEAEEKAMLVKPGPKENKKDQALMHSSLIPPLMASEGSPEMIKETPANEPNGVESSESLTLEARFRECLEALCPEIFGWKTVGGDNIKTRIQGFKQQLKQGEFSQFQSICTGLKDAFSDSELRDWVQLVIDRLDEKAAPIKNSVPLPTQDLSEFPPLPAMPKKLEKEGDTRHVSSPPVDPRKSELGLDSKSSEVLDQIKMNMDRYDQQRDWGDYKEIIDLAKSYLKRATQESNIELMDIYNQWFFTAMNLHDEKRRVEVAPGEFISLVELQFYKTYDANRWALGAFNGDHPAISILRQLCSDEASVKMSHAINRWIHITMQSVIRDVSL